MASSGEHIAAPGSDEVADSINKSSTPTTETTFDNDTAAETLTASKKDEEDREAQHHSLATSAEALSGGVDNLSLDKEESRDGESDIANTVVPMQQAAEATQHTEGRSAADAAAEKDAREASGQTDTQAEETTNAEPSTSSSGEPTSSAGKSASEKPLASHAHKLAQHNDSDLAHPTRSHAVIAADAAASDDQPRSSSAVFAEPAERAADIQAETAADASNAPSTLPTTHVPQPSEKSRDTEASSSVAQPDFPSTPNAQKSAPTDREALADPESVAAVAHAFGRDSPALGSSMDTPQRIATPTENARKALQATSEKEHAKPEYSIGQDAEASSENASKHTHAAVTSSGPEHTAAIEAEKGTDGDKGKGASHGGIRIGKGPPPATQASEELPFDFNRFLEQMKHRSAQPVGEYVRSFIKGFAKKPYRTQDQIKLIFDFLDFIAARMRECDVWKNLGETDFGNAKEAMEKLVMNRLYPYTFTPAVQKEGRWAVQTDDLERDRVLSQRIGLFGWLSEEHLDVPVGDHSRGFIEFSIQELLKINHYKAPRDKLICILNCCKVIFGMIRHLSTQENADTFIPVLIFVVLKANPEHLISNVEYISRFRNPDRLSSESGYYLSSLMGAIAFIETMDCTSLSNITQEEFEKRVEEAVSSLPEPEPSATAAAATAEAAEAAETSLLAPSTTPPPRGTQSPFGNPQHQRSVSANSVSAPSGPGEEAAKPLPFTPMAASIADDTRAFFLRTGEAARTGLSRPMGALGRLINEGIEGIRTPSSSNNDSGASTERQNSPAPTPAPGSTGMASSTSRSKLFGGLFGSLDTSDSVTQPRTAGYPGQHVGRRSNMLVEDEPQTPSTGDLVQDGFHPYHVGAAGGALNAPPRLIRPNMPQRNYSIDDTMFDDESAGRRNLMAGQRDPDYYDDEDEDEVDAMRSTSSATAAEQMRRRMQMEQDFGRGFNNDGMNLPRTPTRQTGGAGSVERGQLQPGRREVLAFENAQTEQAIQRSLMDQERLDAVQADEAAQNSASVETLKSIFPTMDDGVIQMVLQGCEGNVETAIDRLLEMQ